MWLFSPRKILSRFVLSSPTHSPSAASDAFRVALFDGLRLLKDVNDIQATAARILGEHLGASRVLYIEVLSSGEQVIVHKNYTDGVAELSGLYHLEDFGRSLTDDHRAGRAVIVADVANSAQYTAPEKVRYQALAIAAHLDIPLIKNDQFVALLAVHQAIPRTWSARDVQWVEETAERTWAAVERARAEAALSESEAKYRTLFESMDEGMCLCEMLFDEQGKAIDYRFLEVNAVFEQLTGLTHPIGKTALELVPDLESHWFELYGTVVKTGNPVRFEQQSVAMNRWFSVNAFCIGEPQHHQFAVLFTNITDIKRVESEREKIEGTLRASEARFRQIFESKMIGMGIWQRAGGMTDANDALLEMIGYSRADLEAGRLNWQDITPPEQRWLDEQSLADIAISGTSPSYEKDYIHKQGHRIPILIGAGAFAGTKDTGVFFAIDLSDRKAAEVERERLLQQEQSARVAAEQANRVKDEFLAVLSHELRSPLNPILGWTRLLRSGKLDADRQVEALATIERNAKLQLQLIEDLLDISRIMQGKLTLKVESVNLAFVISAALETVQLAAEAKQIQITLDLAAKVAPISGDVARLQQVVWNLLTNAIKFTPAGGQVQVELRQLDGLAQIRVIDTGKGIQPQFLPHIFEYFRQEDGSITRRFGGLGLGLAIVRQIVEIHGGTVSAESGGENQGATLIVQLPILQQTLPLALETDPDSTASEACLKNVLILLVDDDDDTREFQTFLLEHSGATVIATASGSEALKALDRLLPEVPDVIVSDIGMADINGYMLMQQIRARSPEQGGNIPAIALTAYAAEIDHEKALQVGFQKHLSKPLESDPFIRAIVNLLQR